MSEAGFGQPHTLETAGRVGGLMLVAGGVLSVLLLVAAPGYPQAQDGAVAGTDLAAVVLGASFVSVPRMVPRALVMLIPVLGAALVFAGMLLAPSASSGRELLLIWPILFCGYFLPWRMCWLSAAAILAAYVVVGMVVHGVGAGTPVVLVGATSMVTLLIVASLRARLARVLEASLWEARTDSLTGLLNRRAFDELSAHEVARCRREGVPLAVLIVDLDFFKHVNDTYGHPAGDTALRQIAGLLHSQARESDVLARFGGEEFAMLLPACPPADAQRRAQQVRALVEHASAGWISPLTVSIGVAVLPVHADDLPGLIAAADAALYAAKSSGRNAVEMAGAPTAGRDSVAYGHGVGAVDAAG